MVNLDDVMVMGTTFEEHLQNLCEVFNRPQAAGLRFKPSKCHLAKRKVEYLGYTVTNIGIAADPKKVEAVHSFPVPSDLKSLRSFLGLASYYWWFIPNFSRVAHPLFVLTRKDVPCVWNPTCEVAFVELKKLLTEAPVLAFQTSAQVSCLRQMPRVLVLVLC